MKCSRCSVEGRAGRDPGHTAPRVTPPRHNLRDETRGEAGENQSKDTKRRRERERETRQAELIEFIQQSSCYQTHLK